MSDYYNSPGEEYASYDDMPSDLLLADEFWDGGSGGYGGGEDFTPDFNPYALEFQGESAGYGMAEAARDAALMGGVGGGLLFADVRDDLAVMEANPAQTPRAVVPPPTGVPGFARGTMKDAMALSGVYDEFGRLVDSKRSGFQAGKPDEFGGALGGGNNRGQGGGREGDIARILANVNAARQEAAARATADRNAAIGATDRQRALVAGRLGKNPFGAEFQAQALGILQDATARQYAATVEELRQAYAQQGKPLDPRLLLLLRQKLAREANGDRRGLLVDVAGKRFAADQAYVNAAGGVEDALINVLANTQYPLPQSELAMLAALAGGR